MRILYNILLITILSVGTLNAQPINNKIDSILNDFYNKGMFNGSALVSMNGKIVYKSAFGLANFEYKIPNKHDTKFEIGSCTKQFTVIIIMMLKEKGQIRLDGKITDYLPEYPAEKGDRITIHHLLSHTSGIPEYIELPEMECLLFRENMPTEIMKVFWNLDLDFEPGSELRYSNSNFFILGAIIEKIMGKSYAEVLQKNIFNPLGMTNTGVTQVTEILKDKAYGYIKLDDTLTVAPCWNTSGAFSAGNIYSTVEDLFKWQLALLSNRLIKKESFEIMLTLNFSRYGYGFAILNRTHKDGSKYTLFGHEGEIPGFRSLINIVKEDNSSVILLDNNQNPNHFEIASAIRNVVDEEN